MFKGLMGLGFAAAVAISAMPVHAQTTAQTNEFLTRSKEALQTALPELSSVFTDSSLMDTGRVTCQMYDRGYSVADAMLAFGAGQRSSPSYTPELREATLKYTAITVGYAWLYLCPANVSIAPRPTPPNTYVDTRDSFMWTVKSDVNVRAEPNATSQVLTTIPLHTTIIRHGYQGDWIKVTVHNTDLQGWVRSDLLGMD